MSIVPTGISRIFREPAPDPNLPEIPASVLTGAALAAVVRIVDLQLQQAPLHTFTAEVLPAMLDIFDAPAGALLVYRREDATLTLAAARGLSIAGAEALDVLRWGDDHGSEMPLRALVDRKIYLVARPEDDAFIRQLTGPDERRPLSAVAAVPLYRWQLPVGVMLVLGGHAPLAADILLAPTFVYAVLSLALSSMLWARDERDTPQLPASDVTPPPLICVPWIARRHEASGERVELEADREAGIAAVREENGSTLDILLQEIRAAVSGMEAERQTATQERAALGERLASVEQERHRLAEQLAKAERDRDLFTARLDSLEHKLNRRPESTLAKSTALEPEPVASAPSAPAVSSAPGTATLDPAAMPPAIEVAGPALTGHRVMESDAALSNRILTALSTTIPAGRGGIAAVNLLGCDAARLSEMGATADAGMVLIGYVSDPERGSRILGPLRCFAAPPTASEVSAAVETSARAHRRTITLSEDIDAFMVTKTALTKAGHSVSMACDEKQALDLLAILRPDTVVVDVRGDGQPAVEFLDALGPETGRVLTLLVHGDPTGATLAHLADRMLRPSALDVNELAKVCRNASPDAVKRTAGNAPHPTR